MSLKTSHCVCHFLCGVFEVYLLLVATKSESTTHYYHYSSSSCANYPSLELQRSHIYNRIGFKYEVSSRHSRSPQLRIFKYFFIIRNRLTARILRKHHHRHYWLVSKLFCKFFFSFFYHMKTKKWLKNFAYLEQKEGIR